MACKKACFIDKIALVLLVIGGINWGLVGIFEKDLLMGILTMGFDIARIVYLVVGVAGLWGLFSTLGRLK